MPDTVYLGQKQEYFMKCLGQLLIWIHQQPGYSVRGGELERSKIQAQINAASGAGIANSNHLVCLAIDLKLFINGVYRADTESYKAVGDYWKNLSSPSMKCCWGGDFSSRPDGNHFSIEHNGVK